ncbi:hypothetical protein D9C73_027686 [Collichthys lucidus]|uniref:Sterile alpha motif domain-containing protein 3 n=1 Tax=Collichthys lucidus TaxID=240159 RepID=A0A4U5TTN8_COLLU|nr:hypothetical protein D9C73_027686 [Collichthys lucidus]
MACCLDLKDIVELVVAPVHSDESIAYLECKISEHRQRHQELFPNIRLLPKHHYLEHYPALIRLFGPLIHKWTLRFEAKHSFFKQIARHTNCFKNIPLTLARKHQLTIASDLHSSDHRTPLLVTSVSSVPIDVLQSNIATAIKQRLPDETDVHITKSVSYNGMNYNKGMIVVHGQLFGLPEFAEILQICVLQGKIHFIVKKLSAWYREHFRSFELDTSHMREVPTMAQPIRLRVILGEDDARKLILPAGIPDSIQELCQTVKTSFRLQEDFRLQYQDADFGNDFVNLSVTSEIHDKATIKVVYLSIHNNDDTMTRRPLAVQGSTDSLSVSSVETDNTEPASSSGSSPSTRLSIWPSVFTIPSFNYDAELQLDKANAECSVSGTHLSPSPKLKSHILEKLAEEIIKFKAYPTDNDLNDVAEALVNKHPCLKEQGSFNGCYGWKISLKYKMANFRTKLRGLGCHEVTINSLKHKAQDKAALNVKKPRRAEVNYCPQHPKGETTDTLENERIALLSEIKKRNNDYVVALKMEKTFSYRRQEVLQGQPLVADFKSRWPALFTQKEIDNEFMRISTVPLMSTFFAELDQHSPRMMELFRRKGGAAGKKIKQIMVAISKDDTIHTRRACILKSLCVYLNEDHEKLVKEYMNTDTEANTSMEKTVMGVYIIQKEADPGDDPEDIGVLIEGVKVLSGLGDTAIACALLFGLIYCLNLSYPPELKCTFEVLQKILLKLDGQRLSSKAQFLKNKLIG